MFEGVARVFAAAQNSCEVEGTCHHRRLWQARRSGVFLCFVSLGAQRNEGVERERNPATRQVVNPHFGTVPASTFPQQITHPHIYFVHMHIYP